MIKINLLEKKKISNAPIVLGIDLGKVNLKLVGLSIVMLYVPDLFVYPMFDAETQKVQEQIAEAQKKLDAVNLELKGSEALQAELNAYNEQIEKLKQRTSQIEQILKIRTNPKKLLEKLARSTPEDLWFEALSISGEKALQIKGASTSYKSIGSFIVTAKESPFFSELTLSDSKTREDNQQGKVERVEEFVIDGKVSTYDPY